MVEWNKDLNTAEGKKKMLKITTPMRRIGKRKKKQNFIKDDPGKVKVDELVLYEMWIEYI